MKKGALFISCVFIVWSLNAQDRSPKSKIRVIHPTYFGISKPLKELFTEETDSIIPDEETKEMPDRERRSAQIFKHKASDGEAYREDMSVRQTTMGLRKARVPLTDWAGQNSSSTPPDPTGAAGMNHYVQIVNSMKVKIFDKFTGSAIGTVFNIGSLWSPAVHSLGDPVVLYDKYADRWILTHLGTTNNSLLIAVSTSGDPTGTYFTYSYTSPDFPDYPKYSIWADGYYMTTNYISTNPLIPEAVFCFERNEMLAGNPAARSIFSPFDPGISSGFFVPMPADADGELPPFGTPLPFISYYENAWGGGVDSLKIWNMTVDWTPVSPTATVSGPEVLFPAPFDGTYDQNWNDIPQPNTNAMLDGMGGIIQFRTQWRKWSGYNTLVVCWPVKLTNNPMLRSIRWAELRQDQQTDLWSIYQESTYAPDNYSRWISSIAMDDEGNIGLCYAKSGQTTVLPLVFPSLAFTGRLASDPLNTMTIDETTVIAGSGTLSGNRFGDYSQTSLDPDGLTFWNTAEYIVSPNSQRTRIYSFRLSSLTTGDSDDAVIRPELFAFQSANMLMVQATNLPSNDIMVLDLFDSNGRFVQSKMVTPSSNRVKASIDISSLAKGNYLVRIGKTNSYFQKVIKIVIL